MKRILASFLLSLALMPSARAEKVATLEGEIATVAPGQNVLSVTTEPGSNSPDVRVVTDEETQFVGVLSLEDLRLGDKVEIAAVEDPGTNTWDAETIEFDANDQEDPALAIAREVINDETILADRSSLARVPPPSPRPLENETAPESGELPQEPASETPIEPALEDTRPEEGGPPHRPSDDDQRNFSR